MDPFPVNGTITRENVEIFDIEAYGSEIRIYASTVTQKERTSSVNFVRSMLSHCSVSMMPPKEVQLYGYVLTLTATDDLEHCICRAQITDLSTFDEGYVKVLLLDEGRWNVSVPLEQLFICPLHVHINKVGPLYEMFLLADVIPLHSSWNPRVIHKLKLKLQRNLVPAIVNRNEINFIRPFDIDSGQPWIMELFTAGYARLLPTFPELAHNLNSLAFAPCVDKNPLEYMPFTAYSNITRKSQLPVHSYGPSGKLFLPKISNQEVSIPATYSSGVIGSPMELKYSLINSQNISNTSHVSEPKNYYWTEKLTEGQLMKGKVIYIVKGPWKFFIQFDNQKRQLEELKEQLNTVRYVKHSREIKQCFQLVVRMHGEFYRALALQDECHGKIQVFFVDMGYTGYVDISEAFILPESLNGFPLLVTRCKLAGLPKKCDDIVASKFVKFTLNNDLLKIDIKNQPQGVHQDLVEVDMFLKGHSVLEILIGYRQEVLNNEAELRISHVCEDDEIIYLQDEKRAKQLESMQLVLQDNAKTAAFCDVESLDVNDVCIAMFPSDQNWYRAKILSIGLATKVQGYLQQNIQVFYVDYGNTAWVSIREIRKIEPALQELMPTQAIPTIFKDLELKDLPSNHVMKLLKSRVLKVKIVKLLHIRLYTCTSLVTVPEVEVTDQSSGKKITEVIDFKLTMQLLEQTSSSGITMKRDCAEPPQIQLYSDSLKLCRITSAQTPKCFCVTLVENDELIKELSSELNNRLEEAIPVLSGNIGQIVTAKWTDQCWHRALITRNYGMCVELFLIDNGREMKATVSELRVLPHEHHFWTIPAQAIKCALDLDDISIENPRLKESFRNQAMGRVQNVHFKKNEHNTWKVAFVERFDVFKVLSFLEANEKANIYEVENINSEVTSYLKESIDNTNVCSAKKNLQVTGSSKELTNERNEKVSRDFGVPSTSRFPVNKPLMPKQHWKDMIINNLPAEVVAKHKRKNNSSKLISELSIDNIEGSKFDSYQALKSQIKTWQGRNSSDISKGSEVSSKINLPNTLRLGSIIEQSRKKNKDNSIGDINLKNGIRSEEDKKLNAQGYKMQTLKDIDTVAVSIIQTNMQYLQQNIELYTVIKLVITWVESPVKYFCQLTDSNTEIFDIRMNEAQLEYNKLRDINKTNAKTLSKYPIGSAVMAYFGLDEKWYRGTVLEYADHNQAKVKFVDYGNTEMIPISDIFPMKEKFITDIPQQAISILINDDDQAISKFNVQLLRAQLENIVIECIFGEKLCSFEYQATSLTINGKDIKVFISDNKNKFPTGMRKPKENYEISGQCGRYTHCSSLASIIAKNSDRERNLDKKIIKKDELPKGQFIKVYVSHVDDKSFWVQRLDGVDELNDMMEKLQCKMSEYYAESELSCPNIDQYCTCKYSEDNDWYRAKIIEVSETQATVQYIDYGNNEKLENSTIYQLLDEFTKLPEQAIHCCLPGFPDYDKEYMMILNSLIKENSLLNILSYESFDDLNVVYTVTNKEMTEIPKSLIPFSTKSSYLGCNDNAIGKKSCTFNSEITNTISGIAKCVPVTSILEIPCEKLSHEESVCVPIMAKDLVGPVPLLSKSLVYIVHMEEVEGQVWLQRAEDTETLTILQENIENCAKSQQVHESPYVDLICIGKSCEDGLWYRAKVIEKFVDAVLVYYLDFGNTEKIPMSQCKFIPKQLGLQRPLAYSCFINVMKENYLKAINTLKQYFDQELIVNLHGVNNDNYIVSLFSGQKNILEEVQEKNNDSHAKGTYIVSGKGMISHSTYLKPERFKMEEQNPLKISFCLVKVKHVETDRAVWIQCVDSVNALEILIKNLHEYMKSLAPTILNNPTVGEACVCQYSEDNCWYRARVLKTDPSAITVLYVDNGNVDILEPSKVYTLPQDFVGLPEQAIKCGIPYYCKEMSKNWLNMKCLVSLSIYDNHPIISFLKLGKIKYIPQDLIKTATYTLNKDCNSIPTEAFIDPAEENRWNVTLATTSEGMKNKPNGKSCKNLLKRQDPSALSLIPVIISHFENDGSLWLQHIDSNNALATLRNSLHEYMQTAVLTCVNNPLVGEVCLCCYSEDNEWYRARVLEVVSDPFEITVLYVDYGNKEIVESCKLYTLPEEFCSLPEQAFKCALPDYCKKNVEHWVDQMCVVSVSLHENLPILSFLQIGEVVYIHKDFEESMNVVEFVSFNNSNHSKISIGSKCAWECQAYNTNLVFESNINLTNTSCTYNEGKVHKSNIKETLNTNEPLAIGPVEEKKLNKTSTLAVIGKNKINDITSKSNLDHGNLLIKTLGKQDPSNILTCMVIVTHAENESIWVQLKDSDNALKTLTDSLQENMEKITLTPVCNPVIGDTYVCRNSEDRLWYRIRLLNIDMDKLTVTVLYVDYGNAEMISQNNVYSLPQDFFDLPELAIECRVPNYCRKYSKNWLQQDCKVTVSVHKGYPFITFLQMGNLKYIPLDHKKVEYIDKFVSSNSINQTEFSNINESICKDVYILETSMNIECASSTIDTHSSAVEKSGLNYTNIKQNQAYLERLEAPVDESIWNKTAVSIKTDIEKNHCSSKEVNVEKSTSPMLEKLCPFDISHCNVTVSHVESDGIVWIRRIDSSGALESCMNSLNKHMEISILTPVYNPSIGDICICHNLRDSRWYRVRVLSIATDLPSVTVLFVDYGNVEILDLSRLYKLPPSYWKLPEQAIMCLVPNYYKKQYSEWKDQNCVISISNNENLPIISYLNIKDAVFISHKIKNSKDLKNNDNTTGMTNVNDILCRKNVECNESYTCRKQLDCNERVKTNEDTYRTITTSCTLTEMGDKESSTAKDFSVSHTTSMKPLEGENLNNKSTSVILISDNKLLNESTSDCISGCILKKQNPYSISACSALVSYVECDGTIWIQCMDSVDDLKAMMDSLQKHMNETPIKIDCPTVGEACVSQYIEDHFWYRARILEVNTDTDDVSVVYVDYGNRDTLQPNKLFKLPQEFCSLPEQAIKCEIPDYDKDPSLRWIEQNCIVSLSTQDGKSIISYLNIGDSKYISQNDIYIDDGKELSDVKQMNGYTMNDDILEYIVASDERSSNSETCTKADLLSLWESSSNDISTLIPNSFSSDNSGSLTEESLWNKTAPVSLIENSVMIKQLESLYCSNSCEIQKSIAMKDSYNCISASIIFVESNIVWIHLLEYSALLDNLMDELHEHMQAYSPTLIVDPCIGDNCVCCYSEDNGWYRGRIMKVINNPPSVRVFYIDYGNFENQKQCNIYKLPQKFIGFPQQAIKCRLPNVSNELISNLLNKKCNLSITKVGDDFVIQYLQLDDKEYILKKPASTHSPTDQISLHLSSRFGDLIKIQDTMEINKLKMKITHIENNSAWIQHESSLKYLDILMDDLDNFMKESPQIIENPFIGQACVSQYSEDGYWYRGRVLNVTEDYQAATILFCDYGNTQNVECSNLFSLPIKFTILPEQAVRCIFPDYFKNINSSWINKECVVSVTNAGSIPVISYFKLEGIEHITNHEISQVDMVEENIEANKDMLNVSKQTNICNKLLIKSSMWENIPDATNDSSVLSESPNNSTNESVGQVLGKGLQVSCDTLRPQTDDQQCTAECYFGGEFSEVLHLDCTNSPHLDGFQNIQGGKLIETEIEVKTGSQTSDEHFKFEKKCCEKEMNSECDKIYGNKNTNSGILIKELEELSYPVNSALKLIGICNESDDIIWVQIFDNQPALKEMMNCLDVYMKTIADGSCKIIPKVGDLCVTKYSKNGLWHRARVLGHSEDLLIVTVRYIDYGFKETLEGQDLYPLSQEMFANLPQQAIQCCLQGNHSELSVFINKIGNKIIFNGSFESGHDLPFLRIEEENLEQYKEPNNSSSSLCILSEFHEEHQRNIGYKSVKCASETGQTEQEHECNHYLNTTIQESMQNTLDHELCPLDDEHVLCDILNSNNPITNTFVKPIINIKSSSKITPSKTVSQNEVHSLFLLSDTNKLNNLLPIKEMPSPSPVSCEQNYLHSVEVHLKLPAKEKPLPPKSVSFDEKVDFPSKLVDIQNQCEFNFNLTSPKSREKKCSPINENEDEEVNINVIQVQPFCALLVHVEESPFCLWVQEEDDLDTVDFVDSTLEQIRMKSASVLNPEIEKVYGATVFTVPLRIKVKEVGNGEAHVHFIDQGRKSWISTSRIFSIPTYLSEIKPLAKLCFLPVTIIPGRQSGAALAIAETVLKTICVCVDIGQWYREEEKSSIIIMSSPMIGSISKFLEGNDLAVINDWRDEVGSDITKSIESSMKNSIMQVTKSGQKQNSSLLDNTLFVTAESDLAEHLTEFSFPPSN